MTKSARIRYGFCVKPNSQSPATYFISLVILEFGLERLIFVESGKNAGQNMVCSLTYIKYCRNLGYYLSPIFIKKGEKEVKSASISNSFISTYL